VKPNLTNLASVEADEIAYAMAVGSAAATGRIPGSGVRHLGVSLQRASGEVQELSLTDIPSNRAMIAIRDQFPKEKFQPIMMRVWALGELLDDQRMQEFIRPASDGDGDEIHSSVYEIAGKMPLNGKGLFNRATFFRRVKAIFDQGDLSQK
jgi:hypothetical protein